MPIADYSVGDQVYDSEIFRAYGCNLPSGGEALLKIAATAEENSSLDREALILRLLHEEAAVLEREFQEMHRNPARTLGYHVAVPKLVESFACGEQGGRWVNVLDVTAASPQLVGLAPVSFIAERDSSRVDPKTSAWMLGKTLKLLAFAHSVGVTLGESLSPDTLAIERAEHFVVQLDWTRARLADPADVSPAETAADISRAAKIVLGALGGDPETAEIPEDPQLEDGRYAAFLRALVDREVTGALAAHKEFYGLIGDLWPPNKFHKYTTYPL